MACKACVRNKFFKVNDLHASYVVRYGWKGPWPSRLKVEEDNREYENEMVKIMSEKCPECPNDQAR